MRELYCLKPTVKIRRRIFKFGQRIIINRRLVPRRTVTNLIIAKQIGGPKQLQALREGLEQVGMDAAGALDNTGDDFLGAAALIGTEVDVESGEHDDQEGPDQTHEQDPEGESQTGAEDAGAGAEPTIETPDGSADPVHTYDELISLKMGEIRAIGNKFDVKDNDKRELVDKILKAQLKAKE